jgi:ABC-type polysaccharide/polyol phosphate transport system ATPase subunit
MLAIRISNLGCYFGPQLEIDGAERPREAWRSLRLIAGLPAREPADGVQRTVPITGHVLRGLSLDIEQGSVVCLAGPSGSGKSVLLQILAGVLPPTEGRIELFAPVRPLVTLGDNVDEQHSAIDNIRSSPDYLAAASAEDAERYAAEVIEFAGLHEFEHVPLRTYSTGMLMRLSVAMALSGRPSIVLIDDVLTVGDLEFQQRCIDRVHALKAQGCTLVLAFSDDALVQQLATRIVTLGGGRVVSDTTPALWVTTSQTGGAADLSWEVASTLPEDDVMALQSVTVEAARDGDASSIDVGLTFDVRTGSREGGTRCRPSIFVIRGPRLVVFRSLHPEFVTLTEPGTLAFGVRVPTDILPDEDYAITASMTTIVDGRVYSMKADIVKLSIRRGDRETAAGSPLVALPLPWEIDILAESAQ